MPVNSRKPAISAKIARLEGLNPFFSPFPVVFSPQTPENAAESHLHFPVETVIVGARQHRRRISHE